MICQQRKVIGQVTYNTQFERAILYDPLTTERINTMQQVTHATEFYTVMPRISRWFLDS